MGWQVSKQSFIIRCLYMENWFSRQSIRWGKESKRLCATF